MPRLMNLSVAFVVSLVALVLVGACSTDEICDEACAIWDNCEQVEGNFVNYSYEECYADCKAEGDWTRSYIRCLREQYTCPALGNQC